LGDKAGREAVGTPRDTRDRGEGAIGFDGAVSAMATIHAPHEGELDALVRDML